MFVLQLFAQCEGSVLYYVSSVSSQCQHITDNDSQCHLISYYTSCTNNVWPPNVTLIFLPGEHSLTTNLYTRGIKHLRLLGHQENQPVRSEIGKPSVVKCHNTRGFDITGITELFIEGLVIDCSVAAASDLKSLTLLKVFTKSLNLSNVQSVNISKSWLSSHEGRGNEFNRISSIVIHSTLITGMSDGLHIDSVDQYCMISLTHVTILNNSNTGIDIICRHDGIIYFDHVRVENNGGSALSLTCKYPTGTNCELFFHDTILGRSALGSNILCSQQKCWTELNSVIVRDTRSSDSSGLVISCNDGCYATITNITVINNSGVGLRLLSGFKSSFALIDSSISHNGGIGLLTHCFSVMFVDLSNVTISNNNNTGFFVDSYCMATFYSKNSIISNNHSPTNGGGLWVTNGCIVSSSHANVSLVNNTAQGMGGAIYSPENINSINECTFYKLSVLFFNNHAVVSGDNVYNGIYWQCTYMSNSTNGQDVRSYDDNLFTKAIDCSNNPTLSFFPRPHSSYITSRAIGVCLCRGDVVDCNTRSINKSLFPGQLMTLSLVAVGVCGGFSPTVLVTGNTDDVSVSLETINQEMERKCKDFKYLLSQPNARSKEGKMMLGIHIETYRESSLIVNVTFKQCPAGLELISGVCQCSTDIRNDDSTKCSIDWMPRPIRRSGNNWLSYNQQYNCTVAHKNCPFDYCNTSAVYLNLTHPDLQCTNGRSGTLCGECQPGLSLMLGSNKCERCSNKFASLVIAFVAAGIGLFIFLLVCNLTVSVGSINGLLFYVNVIKLNEAVLFPNGVSIPVLSQFIAWLNLDLGIQTCFFNGLDGYWKTWLQFGFSLTLIAAIIVCCKLSSKLSHLFGRNVVSVLSTLTFMAHSKLLLAIRNALMLAVITCGERRWYVWSIDGNIEYLSSKYLVLLGFSLFMMLIGLMYTLTIFSGQWMMRLSGKYCRSSVDPYYRLKPFLDAYTGPYKDKYRYWTGLLLIVRLLMTTVFSYTTGTVPQVNNCIIVIIVLIVLPLSRGVYFDRRLNGLEYFYLLNLGSVSLINGLLDHMRFDYHTITASIAVSVGLSLVAFACTVVVHIYVLLKRRYGKKCQRKEAEEKLLITMSDDHSSEEMYSPAHIISRREPLIFEFD